MSLFLRNATLISSDFKKIGIAQQILLQHHYLKFCKNPVVGFWVVSFSDARTDGRTDCNRRSTRVLL